MIRLGSYIRQILNEAYLRFNKNRTTTLDPRIDELVKENCDTLYSPEVVNYLITKHMGEIEYSLLVKDYLYHSIDLSERQFTSIKKMKFIDAIEQAYKDGSISSKTYLKTQKLRNSVSFDMFLSKHSEDTYKFIRSVEIIPTMRMNEQLGYEIPKNIRKEDAVELPVKTLIELLQLPYDELAEIMEQKPFGLTKEEFAYTVLSYFKLTKGYRYKNETPKENMLDRYKFPEQIINNIKTLEKSIDITLIEEIIQEPPTYLQDVKVSEELWKKVMSKVPNDFNGLEKAYYIYYQLCKTLTYSFSYFKHGETRKKSGIGFINKIYNLDQITPESKSVICYELMAIYEKFLEHLNIPFDIDDGMNRGRVAEYNAHPTIRMAIDDKYFIEADPTNSVIKGDMPLAKENRPLNGFKCKNNTEQTQRDFQDSIDRVNAYIRQEEKAESSFFDVVNAYKNITESYVELEPSEKLSIIMNSITQTELSPTDSLVYISELTKMLFPNGECTNYYILDHQQDMTDNEWKATGIPALQIVLAYQPSQEDELVYYLYSQETGLTQKTHDELQEAFDKERFEYLIRYKKEIPKITISEEKESSYAY